MNRRNFFSGLVGTVAGAVAAPFVREPTAVPKAAAKELTVVVGFEFFQGGMMVKTEKITLPSGEAS